MDSAFPTPLDLKNLAVVLVSPRNPLNIGAVARAMCNFGCSDLRLVKVHPPSMEDARSAVGPSAEIIQHAQEFSSLAEATADCIHISGTVAPYHRPDVANFHSLPQAAPALGEHFARGRVAIVFGPEKTGLSNDDLSHCHEILGIPTTQTLASMNLGQAAAICLYEISKQVAPPAAPQESPATAEHLDRITTLLGESLAAADYNGIETETAQQELRSLTRRLNLSTPDALTLTGMLRKILWKLQHLR